MVFWGLDNWTIIEPFRVFVVPGLLVALLAVIFADRRSDPDAILGLVVAFAPSPRVVRREALLE